MFTEEKIIALIGLVMIVFTILLIFYSGFSFGTKLEKSKHIENTNIIDEIQLDLMKEKAKEMAI